MFKSIITPVLILLGFTLFECSILSNIVFLPSVPDFLLLCVIFYALRHGKTTGESVGIVSGLFLDFVSGCPFGLNCLLRTIIGYLTGFFGSVFTLEGILMPALICFLATFGKFFLYNFITLFFPAITIPYKLLSYQFGFELFANTMLAPFVFKFLHLFDIAPEPKEKK
ncbi:MAG: rod shape-determining protein MreD [Treponema sp.]|nr:rod shape-determining protein MreD [Treponema sp.]